MQQFFLEVLKATGLQLGVVFGFFFAIGFVLAQVQKFTQRQYYQSIGWLGILWTAWIGTPVHELSHWIMAKFFFHRVDSVSLFKPNHASGKLGEVQHSYNPRNWFQQIGNFFIGAAPLIGGVLVLFLLFRFLLPNNQEILAALNSIQFTDSNSILKGSLELIKKIFSESNIHSPRFWIFMYVSFAVASHLAPSPVDQKSMWRGLLWLILLLLIINSAVLFFNKSIMYPTFSWTFLTWIFWYALVVSLLHALVSFLLFWPFRRH